MYTCSPNQRDVVTKTPLPQRAPSLALCPRCLPFCVLHSHNFAPFRDMNPECHPNERWKALAGLADVKPQYRNGNDDADAVLVPKDGIYALVSADGIHWRHTSG